MILSKSYKCHKDTSCFHYNSVYINILLDWSIRAPSSSAEANDPEEIRNTFLKEHDNACSRFSCNSEAFTCEFKRKYGRNFLRYSSNGIMNFCLLTMFNEIYKENALTVLS